jgi:hypothetical protein
LRRGWLLVLRRGWLLVLRRGWLLVLLSGAGLGRIAGLLAIRLLGLTPGLRRRLGAGSGAGRHRDGAGERGLRLCGRRLRELVNQVQRAGDRFERLIDGRRARRLLL